MDKKLVAIGNGVAFFIDKPLRAALGIKANTLVRVITDGRRLIIEPAGERSKEQKRTESITHQMQAKRIYIAVLNAYGINADHFQRLSAGWSDVTGFRRVVRYGGWIELTDWSDMTPAEQATVRRVEACYHSLRSGASWDVAIEAAVKTEPFDPDDPAERSVGALRVRGAAH